MQKFYESQYWERHGRGRSFYDDSKICYDGVWAEDHFDGYGILYYTNGSIKYKGDFKYGNYFNYGETYDFCGKLVCKGHWKNNILMMIVLNEEHIKKGYIILNYKEYFFIGKVTSGKKSEYGEYYNKTHGFLYMKCFHTCDIQNGYNITYHDDFLNHNHKAVKYIGYKKHDNWDGRRCNYHPNGKLNCRQYFKSGIIETNQFTLYYHCNGTMDTKLSYEE